MHVQNFLSAQDFNQCVVRAWTIPNVAMQPGVANEHVSFWSGDWDDLASVWQSEKLKFDLILTAETIYRETLYSKISSVLEAVSSSDCLIYLAAKLAYYGNDGNLEGFCNFLDQKGLFSYRKIQLKGENTCYGCLVLSKIKARNMTHSYIICFILTRRKCEKMGNKLQSAYGKRGNHYCTVKSVMDTPLSSSVSIPISS